jgi:hypothetical protein
MQLLKLLSNRISGSRHQPVQKKRSSLSYRREGTFENGALRTISGSCGTQVGGGDGFQTECWGHGPMATHRSGFAEDFKSFLDICECKIAQECILEEDVIAFESAKCCNKTKSISVSSSSEEGRMYSSDSSTSLHF